MTAIKHFSPSATWDQVQAEESKHFNERLEEIRRAGKSDFDIAKIIDIACIAILPVTLLMMPYGVAFLDIHFG